MKKLLTLLFSFFLLSSPSVFAGDLSDFEIEGISIGDSLLDYMTKGEIFEGIERTKNHYYYLKEPYKYAEVYLYKNLKKYDGVSFFVKNTQTSEYINDKNNKYTILSIRGLIFDIENFDDCLQKRNEIADGLSKVFPNTQKTEDFIEHPGDPSGNSFIDAIYFGFDSGALSEASCTNLEETFRINMDWSNGLSVTIDSEDIISWLRVHK